MVEDWFSSGVDSAVGEVGSGSLEHSVDGEGCPVECRDLFGAEGNSAVDLRSYYAVLTPLASICPHDLDLGPSLVELVSACWAPFPIHCQQDRVAFHSVFLPWRER